MIDIIKKVSMKSDINFLKYRKICYALSVAFLVLSFVILGVCGLNLGIDFSGGILLDASSVEKIDLEKVRADLSEYSPELQEVGKDGKAISIRLNVQSEEKQKHIVDNIKAKLGDKFEFRNVQVVGPKVGGEIRNHFVDAVYCDLHLAPIRFRVRIWGDFIACSRCDFDVRFLVVVPRGIFFDYCRGDFDHHRIFG